MIKFLDVNKELLKTIDDNVLDNNIIFDNYKEVLTINLKNILVDYKNLFDKECS